MKKNLFVFGILLFLTIAMIYMAVKEHKNAKMSPVIKFPLSAEEVTFPHQQQMTQIPPIIKSPSFAGEVTFPHQLHFEEFGIGCETCHHETNAAELKSPHEDYFDDFWIDCKICHHETESPILAQACPNCHHYPPANIADQTLSPKVVIHKKCWECHEVAKGAEASRNCKFCHTGPRIRF